jgi:shikimate kinase
MQRSEQLLKGVNLYLVGMMGSGKTTVGRLLAEQLGYRFFDTDVVIEQVTGRQVRTIFAQDGEEAFRQLETQVLSHLAAYTQLTVATGGGIVLERMNWSYLQHGVVVWLDVAVEQLAQRLRQDTTRPLLQAPDLLGTLQRLYAERRSLYAQADLCLAVGEQETPLQVATRIMTGLPSILKPAVQVPKAPQNGNAP